MNDVSFASSRSIFLLDHTPRALEIAQPKIEMADADADQHNGEAIFGEDQEAEPGTAALGDAGDGEIGRCPDQGAVAAETGTQGKRPPQRRNMLGSPEMRRQLL